MSERFICRRCNRPYESKGAAKRHSATHHPGLKFEYSRHSIAPSHRRRKSKAQRKKNRAKEVDSDMPVEIVDLRSPSPELPRGNHTRFESVHDFEGIEELPGRQSPSSGHLRPADTFGSISRKSGKRPMESSPSASPDSSDSEPNTKRRIDPDAYWGIPGPSRPRWATSAKSKGSSAVAAPPANATTSAGFDTVSTSFGMVKTSTTFGGAYRPFGSEPKPFGIPSSPFAKSTAAILSPSTATSSTEAGLSKPKAGELSPGAQKFLTHAQACHAAETVNGEDVRPAPATSNIPSAAIPMGSAVAGLSTRALNGAFSSKVTLDGSDVAEESTRAERTGPAARSNANIANTPIPIVPSPEPSDAAPSTPPPARVITVPATQLPPAAGAGACANECEMCRTVAAAVAHVLHQMMPMVHHHG